MKENSVCNITYAQEKVYVLVKHILITCNGEYTDDFQTKDQEIKARCCRSHM